MSVKTNQPLLTVNNLSIGVKEGEQIKSLTKDVSFSIKPAEIFSLVGGSGSGKSITAMACLGLLPEPGGVIQSGTIHFEGLNIFKQLEENLRKIRGRDISVIFQEPGSALNPIMTIESQLKEIFNHHPVDFDPQERINSLLKRVGFGEPHRILNSYPYQLSGGMQQRVMIALSLMLSPKILIADEPTTALDVTIQAQIMDLLLSLQEESGMAILFITHNLALVAQYADRVAVMQEGRIVEEMDLEEGINNLMHPYSQELLRCIPKF